MQRKDFAGLFKAMDGFPVVIRTLDPPLHEFLPKREDLMVDLAMLPYADLKTKKEMVGRLRAIRRRSEDLKKVLPELLKRVEELHEFNPMLGLRGCRLGIIYPEITEMQARAIFEAAVQVAKKGVKVIPEVMIPLIGGVKELENQKKIVVHVAEEVLGKAGMKDLKYMVGTMIEIPRAALTADSGRQGSRVLQLRHQRPDADHHGPLARRLYEVPEGVRRREDLHSRSVRRPRSGRRRQAGRRWRSKLGRKTRPDLEIGICGEHGGEPSSVAVLLPRGHELRFLLARTACRSPAWPRRKPRFPAISRKRMRTA